MDANKAIQLLNNRISSNGIKCLTDAEARSITTLLESLAREAESGQIANNLCCETFKFDYRDEDCMDCGMRSYCRLRTGKEAGE